MRTTLTIDDDVLDAAKSVAQARAISVGAALSELARKGLTARAPTYERNGFAVFQLDPNVPSFGPEDIQAADDLDDVAFSKYFLKRV